MAKPGLLLVNLGTPKSTALPDIRAFLSEFLMDGRVITLPWPLRWLLVQGLIVPRRAPLSKWKYERIWTPEGSPLLAHSRAFVEQLRAKLPGVQVELAMRYAEPSMAQALERLQGVDSLSVVPLFPQYAEATTGSVFARLDELLKGTPKLAALPQLRLPLFWDQAGFIEACAQSMERSVELKAMDHVLFSFHGLPKKDVLRKQGCRADDSCCAQIRAECYRSQCIATAKALAARLGLKEGSWGWAFQSRLGKVEWIKPYTSETLEALAKAGARHVAVMCPSFVADCLETLEEIGMDNRDLFLKSGGKSYHLAPCPNSDPAWIESFAAWVKMEIQGKNCLTIV